MSDEKPDGYEMEYLETPGGLGPLPLVLALFIILWGYVLFSP